MLLIKNHKALLAALLFSMVSRCAFGKSDIVGAVFSATDPAQGTPGGNGVMMYHRHADGTLTLVPGSPFPTGGEGVGPGNFPPNDPLGSQNSLIVDQKNALLFVVNAGSNQVSSFRIEQNGLILVDTVSSGGLFPNSLALRDNVLYVLNAGGVTNFAAFKVSKDGHLTPLGSPCNLQPPLNVWPIGANGQPQVTAVPSQIGFSPDGRQLLIVRKEGFLCPDPNFPGLACLQNVAGPGRIDVYALDKKLRVIDCQNPTANINTRVPAGRMPFAFEFSKNGTLLVSEFLGTAESRFGLFGASALSSYCLKKDGTLEVISADVPNEQTGACWTRVACKFVYTSNEEAASVSRYKVNKDGTVKLINGQSALIDPLTPPGFVLESAITRDNRFFYQLVPSNALIYAFTIDQNDGHLTIIGAFPIATPFSGQAGLATFDF